MAILIKVLQMPKSCRECNFFHYEGADLFTCDVTKEKMYDDDEIFKPWKQRSKHCPLIEVDKLTREELIEILEGSKI